MSWSDYGFSGISSSFQNYFYRPIKDEKPEISIESNENLGLPSKEDVKLYGTKAFDCFKEVWDFEDFWKRANTCDACLSLVDELLIKNPDDIEVKEICKTFQGILEKNLNYYKSLSHDDKWIDDFGWWGLLGVNAYKFLMKLSDFNLAIAYLELSGECWTDMINHGYDVNENIKPVKYGCKNSTSLLPNVGVKNSVVNTLLFLLSTKLYTLYIEKKFSNPDPYLKMAYQQWLWFLNWFELKSYGYLKSFKDDEGSGLIGERPLAFFNGSDYQDTSHPDSTTGSVWTGDNGLLIGGLFELMAVKNQLFEYATHHQPYWKFNLEDFDTKIKEITTKLIHGVQKGMIGKDGIFHEPPCLLSYVTNAKDYYGGRGILIRYMDLKKVEAFSGVDFKENILKTVNAIWLTRDVNSNQFQVEFTTDENNLNYVKQFDTLWGISDQSSRWLIGSEDLKLRNAIAQALGMDFLAGALKVV